MRVAKRSPSFLHSRPRCSPRPRIVSEIGDGLVSSFLVSDLDQDGLPDIVVNSSDYSLAVYLNQGDGGFGTTFYPVVAAWQLISVPRAGGGPDLAFGLESAPGGLQLLRNAGDGGFSVGPVYPVEAGWLSVGMFNGDCIPDIVTVQGDACPAGKRRSSFSTAMEMVDSMRPSPTDRRYMRLRVLPCSARSRTRWRLASLMPAEAESRSTATRASSRKLGKGLGTAARPASSAPEPARRMRRS